MAMHSKQWIAISIALPSYFIDGIVEHWFSITPSGWSHTRHMYMLLISSDDKNYIIF